MLRLRSQKKSIENDLEVYSKSALDGLLNQTYKELTIIYFIMLCLEHVRVLMRTSSSKRHHKNRIYSRIFDSS